MIFITGAARSGTTLTASIFEACGANLGKVNSLKECVEVRDGIVKPYLQGHGFDPLGQNPLPVLSELTHPSNFRGIVLNALGPGTQVYKGAKLCLMWPVWQRAFPEATYVIVRRDTPSIVDSCIRTSFMRAFKNREGWTKWVDDHIERFSEMKKNLPNVLEVWPGKFIKGDDAEMSHIVNLCGFAYDKDKAYSCVNANKFRDVSAISQ